MEQIRQLLSQMALNLELNIAMCDKLEQMDKRLDKLEPLIHSHTTKIDALNTRTAELSLSLAGKAYEARTGEKMHK